MDVQESQSLDMPQAASASPGADAPGAVEAIVTAWRDIDAALSPIIGARAVAALHERSLHLASDEHPWLRAAAQAATQAAEQKAMDYAALRALFAQQDPVAVAQAGAQAVLRVFHELLVSMIGVSLAERLLASASANLRPTVSGADDV